MNALGDNAWTRAWRELGASMPAPRAVLAVSAHWYINATAVTAMARPRTIHDFFGFPQELFDFRYDAPGLPELADEVAEVAAPTWVGRDEDSWGLDHGTWGVLCHVFPDAGIPVVQLSVDASKPFDYHLELGARLAPLRDRGVAIVASGNVVHNLRALDPHLAERGFDWAERFDTDVREAMTGGRAGELAGIESHPAYRAASPTPDHFLPLLYVAGLASASPGEAVRTVCEGYALGSLSMTAFALGG